MATSAAPDHESAHAMTGSLTPNPQAGEGEFATPSAYFQVKQPKPPRVEAGALVPVYRRADGEIGLVLIRRSAGGAHGGQLAFPGGKREPQDRSILDTALREAWEEIGIPPDTVRILASLPAADTSTTDFRIFPFLGRITPPRAWQRNDHEVAEIIEIRLGDLARPEAQGEDLLQMPSWPQARRMPFYRIGVYPLWGVSYRILQPLVPRLLRGEWDI
jgi:8-oxo-dGTP pyrophosphatase MutT (NUDIX family)